MKKEQLAIVKDEDLLVIYALIIYARIAKLKEINR